MDPYSSVSTPVHPVLMQYQHNITVDINTSLHAVNTARQKWMELLV